MHICTTPPLYLLSWHSVNRKTTIHVLWPPNWNFLDDPWKSIPPLQSAFQKNLKSLRMRIEEVVWTNKTRKNLYFLELSLAEMKTLLLFKIFLILSSICSAERIQVNNFYVYILLFSHLDSNQGDDNLMFRLWELTRVPASPVAWLKAPATSQSRLVCFFLSLHVSIYLFVSIILFLLSRSVAVHHAASPEASTTTASTGFLDRLMSSPEQSKNHILLTEHKRAKMWFMHRI